MPNPESYQPHNFEQTPKPEYQTKGMMAEELILNTINNNFKEFKARLSTLEEDSGRKDIGMRQTIDIVVYDHNTDRPVMALQVTCNNSKEKMQKKMRELMDHPFVRLPEMKSKDHAIPKGLIYIEEDKVDTYAGDPEFANSPEVLLRFIDGAVNSLKADLLLTKNPLEKKAIEDLIKSLTQEQQKHLH